MDYLFLHKQFMFGYLILIFVGFSKILYENIMKILVF